MKPLKLAPFWKTSLDQKIGQLRSCIVRGVGPDDRLCYLLAYAADFDVDPWHEMFYFPSDTLKLVLLNDRGDILWKRDLGPGVVPGMWFCPFHAEDLDNDGIDEIYFVNNSNPKHPLGISGYVLERLDARTGQTTGSAPWPSKLRGQSMSHTYRYFIFSGAALGKQMLVTAQGTYEDMHLQGRGTDMNVLWECDISGDAPGARGSHMYAVADLDGDGVEEVLWGERIIEVASGRERLCLDRDHFQGHSDIVQPVWDELSDRWLIFTCRENDPKATPRVVIFDSEGRRLWGDVAEGHMDMGWAGRLPDGRGGHRLVGTAIRIGHKTCGPDGRHHVGNQEFAWDLRTGEPLQLGFSTYRTKAVDLNGDGLHEMVRGDPSGDGEVLAGSGRHAGSVGGAVALWGKLTDRPGEQVLAYAEDGTVALWGDLNAEDSPLALRRYNHPYYRRNLGKWWLSGI